MKKLGTIFIFLILFIGAIVVLNNKAQERPFIVDTPFTILVNDFRQENNKPLLTETKELNELAAKKCKDMQDRDYFEHKDPDGKYIWEELPRWEKAGENLDLGAYSSSETVQDWINSKGHRENLLNDNFQYVGHAYCESNDGRWFAVQEFKGL